MNTFIKTGILGRSHGYLIPVTSEDPSVKAYVNTRSEDFIINLYCGRDHIGEINLSNSHSLHPSIYSIPLENSEYYDGPCSIGMEINKNNLFIKARFLGKLMLALRGV